MSDLRFVPRFVRAVGSVRYLARVFTAVICAVSCGVAIAATGTAPASVATSARPSASVVANLPARAVDASGVAVPDAAGVVDPRRAFLLRDVFAQDVTRRLKVPAAEQRAYADRLQTALGEDDPAVLKAAGKSLDDVVRAGVYLTNMSDFAAMNEIYAKHFSQPFPARTTIGVAALPLGACVELDLVVKA